MGWMPKKTVSLSRPRTGHKVDQRQDFFLSLDGTVLLYSKQAAFVE
jgi:hypothetical protein